MKKPINWMKKNMGLKKNRPKTIQFFKTFHKLTGAKKRDKYILVNN